MAFRDRRTVLAIALTAACGSPDFEASEGDAGAGSVMGGSSGASPKASGGTAGTNASGGSSGTTGGRSGATGGSSARGGSTGGGGDASGAGESTGGSSAATGGSATTGGTSGSGGDGANGGSPPQGGTGGTSDGGGDDGGTGGTNTTGGTNSTGGTGGTGGGTGGTDTTGGTGGTNTTGGTGNAGAGTGGVMIGGMGGGGMAGLGTGGTVPIAGTPGGGSGGVIGGCDNQLLANADFESGPGPTWSEETTWPGLEAIVPKSNASLQAEGVAPYGGNYLLWLGGIPDNDWDHHFVVLRQDVTIPNDAATLTLTGYRWVKSIDDDSEEFDVAYLEFDNTAGDVVWQAQAYSNQTTTNGWVAFEDTTSVENAWRGKKLTFVAYSNTDPEGKTSFFIDNLRLEASCGR